MMHLRKLSVVAGVVALSLVWPGLAAADAERLTFPVAKQAMTRYAEEEAAGHPNDTYRIYNCRRRSGTIIWCAIRWRYPAARDEPGATGYYVLHTRTVAQSKTECLTVWEVLWEDKRCVG